MRYLITLALAVFTSCSPFPFFGDLKEHIEVEKRTIREDVKKEEIKISWYLEDTEEGEDFRKNFREHLLENSDAKLKNLYTI